MVNFSSKYCSPQFERIFVAGNVTSPNHPGDYPNNVDRTEIIEVEKGKILRLQFNGFSVWVCKDLATCSCDFVTITDGNGTTLMDNRCGFSSAPPSSPFHFLPPTITSISNRVEVVFHSDGEGTAGGWSLGWSAMTTGFNITGWPILFFLFFFSILFFFFLLFFYDINIFSNPHIVVE